MLKKALDALDMNSLYVLKWGATCMAGFLDECIQASNIIVPFLNPMEGGNI